MSHLLSLSALHAAAPGVLDIVFGADGDFEGAPEWRCMCWDSRDSAYVATITRSALDAFVFGGRIPPQFALDCRIPSVAARLAGLCARADPDADRRRQLQMMFGDLRKPVSTGDAVALASLTLSLAPRIVALKSPA